MTNREIDRNQKINLKSIAIRIRSNTVQISSCISSFTHQLPNLERLGKGDQGSQPEMQGRKRIVDRLKRERRFRVSCRR